MRGDYFRYSRMKDTPHEKVSMEWGYKWPIRAKLRVSIYGLTGTILSIELPGPAYCEIHISHSSTVLISNCHKPRWSPNMKRSFTWRYVTVTAERGLNWH